MPSKSHELGSIPTTFLNNVLKHCLPSIAKIVNLILDTREFCGRWKSTMVQPLTKAIITGAVKQVID